MTEDIVAFTRARLDEDEVRAGRAHDEDCAYVHDMHTQCSDVPCDCPVPARVLRGVEAKRKVLAVARWLEDSGRTLAASEVHRALASEWSTHPDYRPDWSL